jgi:glycosyltransferase involved in cell wall biosynthesis
MRGDGPSKNEIIRLISELNIESYVVIEPPKLLEQEIFGDIDILVLPSLRLEGFGIVLIEAMREGIPIVGTNTSGINEVIEDGYNGKLVEPGSVSQLAAAIQEILGDRKTREALVANGTKTLKEKFDVQRYLTDYRQFLAHL